MSGLSGDARRQAFENLVTEVYTPLLRYLARRTDPATADDVLGDALLVLWRRFDELPADARLPWCFGVARGCLANRRRADDRQRRLVVRIADTARDPVEPADDPALADALQQLSETDQEVLHLWAWEGLPPREIAVVLSISANAASIRLHRATARLRKMLEPRKNERVAGHVTSRQETEVISD